MKRVAFGLRLTGCLLVLAAGALAGEHELRYSISGGSTKERLGESVNGAGDVNEV
jgi:hypothetical protein